MTYINIQFHIPINKKVCQEMIMSPINMPSRTL